MMRALVMLLALVCLTATGRADDARPAYLEIREVRPGLYEITWKTPMRGSARLRMAPRFPDDVRTVPGSYEARVLSDALIERWRIETDGGLEGRELRVDGLSLTLRDVIVRIRFADGRKSNALLRGTRPVFVVPRPVDDGLSSLPRDLRVAVVNGALHALRDPVHVLFAFAVGLAGGLTLLGWALGAFLVSDLLGVAVAAATIGVPPPLGEAAVGIAAALAARMALVGAPRRLAAVAAVAGFLHGAALSGAIDGTVPRLLVSSLGIDVALLSIGAAAVALRAAVRSRRVRGLSTYAVGAAAVALVTLGATRPSLPVTSTTSMSTLPTLGAADPASAAPGASAPARGLTTPMAAYLDVEPFETRLELLARLSALDDWLGLGVEGGSNLEIDEQEPLLERAVEALSERLTIRVDGSSGALRTTALRGFTAFDATGTYFRDVPIAEAVDEAIVGFVFAIGTPGMPNEVDVRWSGMPDGAPDVPARVSDPEAVRDATIAPASPTLTWRNTLRDDPLPAVDAVAVRTPVVPLPVLSILLAAVAVAAATSRRRLRRGAPVARLLLACACVIAPVWTVPVPAPVLRAEIPTPAEASAIAGALLQNLYRAFDYREEQAIYDRLAVSVTGETLTKIYLEHRRGLEIERAGGARARVEAVEVTAARELRAGAEEGFIGELEWTVAGSVTHFGHRHVRQNRYRATLGIVAEQGRWKLRDLELLDEERLR